MKRGKYEAPRAPKRYISKKTLVMLLSLVLVIGCVAGGTLAWLTAGSNTVTNTFTESDISITLTETKPANETASMVPGWKIDKDPKVTVTANSEDCWLFVKITESTTPDLDAYISYAIADGWQIVKPTDSEGKPVTSIENADEIVIGRKVYKDDATKEFGILGAGEYTDPMDADDTADDFKITWNANQVCVKPSVTENMMTTITGDNATKPTLSFEAYAVQLFKTNSDGDNNNTDDEFTAAEAWARAAGMNSSN